MRYGVWLLVLLMLSGCGSGTAGSGSSPAEAAVARVEHASTVQPHFTVNLRAGWNAVAFQGYPVAALEVGPEPAGFAAWNGREYEIRPLTEAELLRFGQPKGIWVYATAATTFTYSAEAYASRVDLLAGWNLASLGTAETVAGSSLKASQDGQVKAVTSAVLPQFHQIEPDNTYVTVDVSAGGNLVPGRAYWVYAASAVSLAWDPPSTTPAPIPWPSIGMIFPSPAPFPSPGAFPSPFPVPSPEPPQPGSSPSSVPSPAASPDGSPPVTSTSYAFADLGVVASVSDDGRVVAALQASGNTTILQHADLQTVALTVDSSANFNGTRGPVALASSADGSLDALLIDGPVDDSLAFHTRSSNSSSLQGTGLPLYPYSEGLDVSAQGNVTVWTETSADGHQTVVFRNSTGVVTDLKVRFPTLDPGSQHRFSTGGRGALSDDGQLLLFRDDSRYVRIDLTTGVNVVVVDANSKANRVFLAGDGQHVLYHLGGAPSLTPVRARVRNLATGEDTAVVTAVNAVFATAISSDGRFVLFHSEDPGLVEGDTNAAFDLFLRDRLHGKTLRVSVDEAGAQLAGHSYLAAMSRNGRWLVFRDPAGSLGRVRNPFVE